MERMDAPTASSADSHRARPVGRCDARRAGGVAGAPPRGGGGAPRIALRPARLRLAERYLWHMRPLGQRTGVLVLAFAMFVATMSLRFFSTPEDSVLGLLTVPVAVIAFEFGWRAGFGAAATSIGWVVVWNQLYLTPLGYFARGATYFLTALVVGLFADRLRAAQVTAMESERRLAELQLERQEQLATATAERARLAREIHDVIAHSVSVMTVQSTAARRVIDHDRARADGALEAIERTGRDALAELRRVISVLRPVPGAADFAPQHGIDDLEALAAQLQPAGLDVTVQFEGPRVRVPAALDVSVYRIAQEALTNTLKHAAAERATVVVRYRDDSVEIECTDDGRGAGASTNGSIGHGLVGMRERALMLGGEIDTGAGTNGGYRVHARLPLNPRA
jgi:signal transduction histidine kinase